MKVGGTSGHSTLYTFHPASTQGILRGRGEEGTRKRSKDKKSTAQGDPILTSLVKPAAKKLLFYCSKFKRLAIAIHST